MKVIMLKNHENVGKIDDIVEVSDGFGQNFLINKGIAILATEENLKRRSERLRKLEESNENARKEAVSIAIQIKDIFLHIYRDGHNNKMFGGVTTSDLSSLLEKEGIYINHKKIKLNEKIRHFGSYEATVDCGNGIKETLSFIVEEK